MRDYQEVIMKFVKIVERYPELYDYGLETYRKDYADKAWVKIAQAVRTELKEECTVEEIKGKWKGIRSSFNRFKKKYYFQLAPCKKYYLYDSLKFLEPFTKPKGLPCQQPNEVNFEDCSNNSLNSDEDDRAQVDYGRKLVEWEQLEIKPEIVDNMSISDNDSNINRPNMNDAHPSTEQPLSTADILKVKTAKKRKNEDEDHETGDSEDYLFFKSIVPDIKDFSPKEKRRLKMGILNLIDTIEDDRKQVKLKNHVTSGEGKQFPP